MKAEELRIGNYIKSPRGQKAIVELGFKDTVVNERDYYARFEDLNEGYYLEHCEPIPLTEELLLKCGFDSFGSRWMKKELPLDLIQLNGFYMANVKEEIKYLHQLQNIFFALTNQELKIIL